MGMVHAVDNENDQINFSIEPAEYRNLFEVDQEVGGLVSFFKSQK